MAVRIDESLSVILFEELCQGLETNNLPMDIRRFKAINAPSYAVVKHVGKQDKQGRYTVVDTRFRVNAGWVLFRNNKQNKSNLQQITQNRIRLNWNFGPTVNNFWFRGIECES